MLLGLARQYRHRWLALRGPSDEVTLSRLQHDWLDIYGQGAAGGAGRRSWKAPRVVAGLMPARNADASGACQK